MATVYTLRQLKQIAKARLIDDVRANGGNTKTVIAILDTLDHRPEIRGATYTWQFNGGTVQYHAAFDEWTIMWEETCRKEKEDSPNPNSIPTSLRSREQPLATSQR